MSSTVRAKQDAAIQERSSASDPQEHQLQSIENQLKTQRGANQRLKERIEEHGKTERKLQRELDDVADLMALIDQRTSHLDQEWEQTSQGSDPEDEQEDTDGQDSEGTANEESDGEDCGRPDKDGIEAFILSAWADDEIKGSHRDELLEFLDLQDEDDLDHDGYRNEKAEGESITGFLQYAEDEGVISRKGHNTLSQYLTTYY